MTQPPLLRWSSAVWALLVISAPSAGAQDHPGQQVFAETCAVCHAETGGGGLGPPIVPLAHDEQRLLSIVREGPGQMMAFSTADISDADVGLVAGYLAQLSGAPGLAGPSTAGAIIEWPQVGGDQWNRRHSEADDITRDNVDQLQVAWTWQPGERIRTEFGTVPGNLATTPLMIDDVLYLSTNYNRVAALDGDSGAVQWIFDPRAYEAGMPALGGGFRHRGVTVYRDDDDLRIFLGSRHDMYCLDAETGELVSSFGDDGVLDLSKDLLWPINPAHLEQNAAPVIYKDLLIVGSSIGDRLTYRKLPPGDVRAFDARTGKLVWTFHPIPQEGEFGTDTWENEAWRYSGATNVWGGLTVDEERELVFLPIGNATNSYYGGSRLGDNLYAQSIVALNANSGDREWYFQIVHHGIWDYDLPTQPILMPITVDGKPIDAVVQLTKQALAFVFDRVTGEPVWPIEEVDVPQSDVPGERTSPTQPIPTRPPPLIGTTGMTADDVFDLTPELNAKALERLAEFRSGPLYTPPSLEGTLTRPSPSGGVNWGGGAYDSETGYLYAKVSNNVNILQLAKFDPETTANPFAAKDDPDFVGYDAILGGSSAFENGLPLNKPPYAFLVAVDLSTGDIAWRVPFGRGSDGLRGHPALEGVELPERLGTAGSPGSIVTKGGLVFVGGGEDRLYAFDKHTGAEVWFGELSQRSTGTPMTYRSSGGRQFVVIATGSGTSQELVAFAIPD